MDKENKLEDTSSPIGVLFENINYYNLKDLEKFINEMNNEQALYCLIQACNSAFKRNAFSMIESEVLSKALRKISMPADVQNT
jgi:hypothetical protein